MSLAQPELAPIVQPKGTRPTSSANKLNMFFMPKLIIDLNKGLLEVEGEESLVREIYTDFKSQLTARLSMQTVSAPLVASEDRSGSAYPVTVPAISHVDLKSYASLSECLAAVQKKKMTDMERTLVAAAYIQETGAKQSISAQETNGALKHTGHEVGNITRAFEGNMHCKPQLIIQLKKAGTSKQARKEYKVTTEGLKFVSNLYANESE